ncbi:MAG: hypothetical protein VX285_01465 [Actinomycetota bacterium]|nr:hypothetical protein [Actinomycetota bacterium]
MIRNDAWGLPMHGSSDEVVLHNQLVDDYLMFARALPQTMESAALSQAPLTRCLLAQLFVMAHTTEMFTAAASLVDSIDSRLLNSREASHLEAARRQIRGDSKGSSEVLEALVSKTPRDVVALRLLHFSLFGQGRITDMVRSVTEATNGWDAHLPRKSLLDGMRCFALCEAKDFNSGEVFGRDAVAEDPQDLWSVHAVAHVLEMTGRWASGVDWIWASELALRSGGSFAGHLWWHLALYLLESGRHDEALEIFDQFVYPTPVVEGLALSNAVALLCRLEFLGVDVGQRWEQLTHGVTYRLGHHSHPFNDCHYAYALGRLHRDDDLQTLLSGMERWAQDGNGGHAGQVIDSCGMAVARGMGALGSGQYQLAHSHLAESAGSWWRLGGSAAQRDVFDQALLSAEINCGSDAAAQHAEARSAQRPNSPLAKIWWAIALGKTDAAVSSLKADAVALGWVSSPNGK